MTPSSAKTKAADPSEQVRRYFAAQPPTTRRVLKQLRDSIRAAAPDAVEHFGYGMPGFKLDGRVLVWYAGWKQHTSMYPITARIRREHAAALAGYEMSTGTVRFPLTNALPVSLVKRLVKSRIVELRKPKA